MKKASIFAICALAGTAAAQPAPPPADQPPVSPSDQQPAPPTAPAPAPEPMPEPAKPEAPKPEPLKKLAVGKDGQGFFNPGILMQGWFLLERSNGATLSTFRLRRAEMSVKGEILPKQVAYSVMIDPAKVRELVNVTVAGPPDAMGNPTTVTIKQPAAAISVLQDFYITLLTDKVDISLGQFKIPVSWEGYNSSSKLYFPERAFVSTTYGDKRDLGVRLAKTFPKWGYSAGVFNGAQLNNLDTNNQKDLTLRLEAYPIKGLTIGGVTYDSIGYRGRGGTKDRWEADVRYEAGPYLLQAEFIHARDVTKDLADPVDAQGFYVLAGYTIKNPDLKGEIQPVVRFGYLDQDTSQNVPATGADELFHYDIGVNYYLKAHEMKLQLAYQRQQFDDKTANNQVIFAAQVAY